MPRVRKFEIVFANLEEFDPVACIRELPRSFFRALLQQVVLLCAWGLLMRTVWREVREVMREEESHEGEA